MAGETSAACDGAVSHCADKRAFAPGPALIILSFSPPRVRIQANRARKETTICPVAGRLRQVDYVGDRLAECQPQRPWRSPV